MAVLTFDTAMAQGLSLVPLRPTEKRPYWKDWQLTPPIREHEDPAEAWRLVTKDGHAGIVARMSGLLAFESDTPERLDEMLALVNVGNLRPCYIERRRGAPYKVHLYVREPYVLDPDEDCGFFFDAGGLVPKITAQMRCALTPESDYQAVWERWDAPRATTEGYLRVVAAAAEIEQRQARALRESTGTAHDAGSRHTTVFRLGCLLYRFTDDDDAVDAAAWRWQQSKFGENAISNRRELRRQLRGSRHKVMRADGLLAAEVAARNDSPRARADLERYLSACLYGTWTDDPDLIAAVTGEVFRGDD